jgi:hypothetical protein
MTLKSSYALSLSLSLFLSLSLSLSLSQILPFHNQHYDAFTRMIKMLRFHNSLRFQFEFFFGDNARFEKIYDHKKFYSTGQILLLLSVTLKL